MHFIRRSPGWNALGIGGGPKLSDKIVLQINAFSDLEHVRRILCGLFHWNGFAVPFCCMFEQGVRDMFQRVRTKRVGHFDKLIIRINWLEHQNHLIFIRIFIRGKWWMIGPSSGLRELHGWEREKPPTIHINQKAAWTTFLQCEVNFHEHLKEIGRRISQISHASGNFHEHFISNEASTLFAKVQWHYNICIDACFGCVVFTLNLWFNYVKSWIWYAKLR